MLSLNAIQELLQATVAGGAGRAFGSSRLASIGLRGRGQRRRSRIRCRRRRGRLRLGLSCRWRRAGRDQSAVGARCRPLHLPDLLLPCAEVRKLPIRRGNVECRRGHPVDGARRGLATIIRRRNLRRVHGRLKVSGRAAWLFCVGSLSKPGGFPRRRRAGLWPLRDEGDVLGIQLDHVLPGRQSIYPTSAESGPSAVTSPS